MCFKAQQIRCEQRVNWDASNAYRVEHADARLLERKRLYRQATLEKWSRLGRTHLNYILAAAALAEAVAGAALAEAAPRVSVGNFGLPGLVDLPIARKLPDGEMVLTQQLHRSLARTGASFQLLPNLGVAFRYSGHGSGGREANGRINHDRSFDAHLTLWGEGRYHPGLAVGLRDFIGTGWYSSEYVVATKSIENFEFTTGLGFGRLAGRDTFENPLTSLSDRFKSRDTNAVGRGGTLGTLNWFQGDASAFGGVSYSLGERITFSAEYSPDLMLPETKYLEVISPWNLGASYRVNDTVSLSAQYLNGSILSLTANISMNPKRPPFGAGRETAPVPMRVRGASASAPAETDAATIRQVLAVDGFEVLALRAEADFIRLDIRNTKYRSSAQALGRATATLQRFTSDEIKNAIIVFHARGLQLSSYKVDLEQAQNQQFGVWEGVANVITVDEVAIAPSLTPIKKKFTWGVGPYVSHRMFNPDLPLSLELGAEGIAQYNFNPHLSLGGSVRKSVITNFTENKRLGAGYGDLPTVASDWGYYDIEGQGGHIAALNFTYVNNLTPNLFARAHAGLLEAHWAGFGGELLYMPTNSPFALGLDLHRVRKRDYEMRLDLQDYEAATGHVSAYLDAGGMFDLEVNVGRYLAGDWGATTRVARKFANGWEIGAYATLTDVPFEDFGEGSFDKGIYLKIPMDWMTGNPDSTRRVFEIRPITRDGGARLGSARTLYGSVKMYRDTQVMREYGRIWK